MRKISFLMAFAAILCALPLRAQHKVIRILHDGEVVQSYPIEQVDSIIVDDAVDAPAGLSASVQGRSVVLTWTAIAGATYEVFRSADNVNYTVLARNLSAASYTDKAPIAGTNYYKVKAIVGSRESNLSDSPAIATLTSSGLESGLYLGMMSFNQRLYTQPISILNAETKPTYDSFIDAMTMKNGTILCYSVDQAINTLQSASLPEDIFNVAVVTFTDGLDQGSLMIDDRFDSDDDFLAAIKRRIDNETVAGQNISAYSIGLRGSDVTSAADIAKFRSTLKLLASSDANATEVSSMAEVKAKFQEIAEQLNSTSFLQTVTLKMPGISNGTRVRFTFDNVASAEKSDVYIEGTFNLRQRSLTDVEYHGMTSTSGQTIVGTVEDIFVTFRFEGIQTESGRLLSSEYIDEWYLTSADSWQINSEFDKDENSDIVNEKKSAVIMLVLDCSSSLGSQFATMQTNAKSFVATLCQTSEDGDGSGNNNNTDPSALYSTTPKDLSLAVVWNGTRYYLTQSEYEKANLSRATVEGVVVISGTEKFIVALDDAPCDNVIWLAASIFYGSVLPTKAQGEVISARWSYINNAIKAFGGAQMSGYKWVNYSASSMYYLTGNEGGRLTSVNAANTYKFRPAKAITDDMVTPIIWNDPTDLLLAVEKDGERQYWTQAEYRQNVGNLSEYNVLGVVATSEIGKFVIALNDEPADAMIWSIAKQLYGDNLPSYNEGMLISARWSYINAAIKAFGGTQLSGYRWVNYSSNSMYYLTGNEGGRLSSVNAANTCKVRLVYR